MIEIEKPAPMPTKRTPYGRHAAMLRAMGLEENAIVPHHQIHNVRTQAARMGMKISARRMEDGKYRVWRIK